ncbi:MAG: bifunctional [glutamate--ammonia ligase]-adenylyl-L-tyrosine phosphorylase/[glutamate--ammonia-ligase] adenylyltransferase [Ottowia sp.]
MVQRLRRRYGDLLPLLAPGCPDTASMTACLQTLRERGHGTGAALRILRSLVMERLVVLDCERGKPLAAIMRAVTQLAELALDAACTEAYRELDARWGAPLTDRGQRARLWVIGMGKLGGRELNVSSDIDLIYVHDHDGQTAGGADGERISVREYFTHAARRIQGLIADPTEHGLVFRIDLALRPDGNAGAVVSSLESLREYLLVQGREWERFAWLKSRVVAPASAISDGSAQALRGVVLPFVFRKYLDYNVFESLRTLHAQIRSHAARRSAGRPARLGDIKLSCGGIREIEFAVQLPQLVRGGQFPELRTRSTLTALERLVDAELMAPDAATQLRQAYIFLRRVEHRIQYLDDQQTHILPADEADLQWLARTMGFDSASAFLAQLDQHREAVAEQFNQLLGESKACRNCHPAAAPADGASAGPPASLHELAQRSSSASVRQQLQAWQQQPRVQELGPRTRQRLFPVMAQTVAWHNRGRVSETAVLRFIDWIDSLLGRDNYLALLQERPVVHERVLHVLNTARWPARYLLQHPAVIDELASDDVLVGRFDADAFEHELQDRRAALVRTQEDSEENLLNLLRRAQHAETFRTLLRDLDRRITVEQVADDLSALADSILRVAVQWCWPFLRRRHREQPRLGIIGYGKLGGKELGYGSDLDLVFVFEDDDERAPQVYAAFVRKLISWLTVKTAEGGLYEIDTALRPNGNAGLLVTRFDAYADYQQRRGSNTAWTWEHQAMTRARMVPPRSPAARGPLPPEGADPAWERPGAGSLPPRSPAAPGPLPPGGADPAWERPGAGSVPPRSPAARGALTLEPAADALGQHGGDGADSPALPLDLVARFDAVRNAVITAPRDLPALRSQIIDMRRRIHAAHPVRVGLFDVKHSSGGMVDVEFVTQYLVLAHSARHPELRPNLGNISLLLRAEQAGLLSAGAGHAAANAYRTLRHVQHRARLDERPTQVAPNLLLRERAAIQRLWQRVLEAPDAPT